ncbi:MAG: hypothetical protein RR900_05295, partial [Ruthenibacterium sp.]
YGMNAVKHCLYIPRDEYFTQTDAAGMLQWVELPLWQAVPSQELPERIRREYPRIIRQISGHPSIILTTLGCELDDKVDSDILCEMYHKIKSETDTLVTDNSGSGECYDGLTVEYADYFDYHFYADLNYMENLIETFTPTWRNTAPWFFGEFCDSDVLRSLAVVRAAKHTNQLTWEQQEIHKNPICVLKRDFYLYQHDANMAKSGIGENFDQKYRCSVNHSMVHRKVMLEMTRAESTISGYNITTLRDVPLCGNGLFDDLGVAKFDQAIFCQSNQDVVLTPAWDLTRIMYSSSDRVQCRERYNFYSGAQYGLHIILSNYSGAAITPNGVHYCLKNGESEVLSGQVETDDVFQNGDVKKLCTVRFTLPCVTTPATFVLWVSTNANGRAITNQWPVFVYPALASAQMRVGVYDCSSVFAEIDALYDTVTIKDGTDVPECDAVLTSRLTPEILQFAQNGGHVALVQRGNGSLPVRNCSFWREGMLWRDMPSFLQELSYENWMDDLRFYSVTTDTAFDFDAFDSAFLQNYMPILRRYDCRQWQANDYMARLSYGKGVICATTLRLEGGAGKQPFLIKNNCIGKYLLHKMLTEK